MIAIPTIMKYNNIKTKKGKAKPNPTKKGFEEDRATSIVRHVTKPCLLTIQHWLKLNKSPNSSVGRALGCFPNGPGFESLFGQRDLFPAEKKGRFRCRQRVMPSPGSCGHQGLTLIQCHVRAGEIILSCPSRKSLDSYLSREL
jgi:hypothetical protein